MNYSTLSDRLPFWHFEDDLMVYADGSFGAGFKLKGMDISCATTASKNEFIQQIENLLSSASEDGHLQVFYKLTSNVEDKLNAHETKCDEQYRPIQQYRMKYFRKKAQLGQYFRPEIYIFYRNSGHRFRGQKLFEGKREYQQITRAQFETARNDFNRSLKQLESSLEGAGLNPIPLSNTDWFDLLFEHFNLDRKESIGKATLKESTGLLAQPLAEQLLLQDIEVHKEHLKIGEYYFKVVTLKTLPEGQSFATMVDGFTKLPFHFWISQNITIHNQKKELEKLHLQRKLANSMAAGSKNMSDLESESKLAHIEELMSELLEGSERILSTDFNVVIWSKDIEELDEKSDYVLKAFRNMSQSEGIVETLPCLDVFLGAMPGSCKGLRYKKMKSSNVAHLAPLYDYWEGNKDPVCLLQNRDGVLVSIHPFASELLNWNGLVFGGSGSGKSFVMCQLMLMFYGHNPRPKVVWLDNGASSQRLVEVLGGEVIDLTIDSNLCINVFDLAPGEKAPGPSKIKLILGVLENIFKEEGSAGLPKRDKALLEEVIFQTYQNKLGGVPILSDLKEILKNHEDPVMRKYAQSLFSWTGQTPYGRLLDGKSNVSLSKDLITIEMKGLDAYPDLQNVFLLLFTDFIKAEASKDMTRPYMLIIDEAWKLFQTASGAAFTFEAYRTFRKFLGGIISISQNYADTLATEELRKSIFPNTSFLFVLKQQVDDWEDFRKKLNLNEAELELVKSIQAKKGEYSEMFLRQNENKTMLRLTPDPLSYWICTSDAQDKAKIIEMERKHPELSKIEVLMKLADLDLEAA